MSPKDTQLTPEQLQITTARAAREGYIHRVLVAFDQFWNVAGAAGLPDETISAHTWRVVDDPQAKHKFLAKVLNHILDDIQPNHGAKAEASDLERAEAVEHVEQKVLGAQ